MKITKHQLNPDEIRNTIIDRGVLDGRTLIGAVMQTTGQSWEAVTDLLDVMLDEGIIEFDLEEDEWSLPLA